MGGYPVKSVDFWRKVLTCLVPSIMKWDIAEQSRVEWGNYRGIQFQHPIELSWLMQREGLIKQNRVHQTILL